MLGDLASIMAPIFVSVYGTTVSTSESPFSTKLSPNKLESSLTFAGLFSHPTLEGSGHFPPPGQFPLPSLHGIHPPVYNIVYKIHSAQAQEYSLVSVFR